MSEYLPDGNTRNEKIPRHEKLMDLVYVVCAFFILLFVSTAVNSASEIQEQTLVKETDSIRSVSATSVIAANKPSAVTTPIPTYPRYTPIPTCTPEESDFSVYESTTPVPRTYSLDAEDSQTVYVSRNDKIHLHSSCSGMKTCTEMSYSEAVERGYVECSKCFS